MSNATITADICRKFALKQLSDKTFWMAVYGAVEWNLLETANFSCYNALPYLFELYC